MITKRYRGVDLGDALGQAKEDLGESATILTTRRVRSGLFRKQVEITAMRPRVVNTAKVLRETKARERAEQARRHAEAARSSYSAALTVLRREVDRLRRRVKDLTRVKNDAEVRKRSATAVAQPGAQDPGALGSLGEGWPWQRLEELGFSLDAARSIAQQAALDEVCWADVAVVDRHAVLSRQLVRSVKKAPPIDTHAVGAVAFVGGPGVGKTNLLAKVATKAKLVEDRDIAIIGCDRASIVGNRATEAIAKAISVPFFAASTVEQVAETVSSESYELIFVDLGFEEQTKPDLQKLLKSAGIDLHLVIDPSVCTAQLASQLELLRWRRPRSVSLTKLDLLIQRGRAISSVLRCDLPLMYLSSGPRIPSDLEVCQQSALSEWTLESDIN